MTIKKSEFNDDEIVIFKDALVYKRGEYWQMRMWLAKEHKYARFSLKTRSKSTAIDRAESHYYELKVMEKQGKSYFSITTKMGVEMYLKQRHEDMLAKMIVPGRYKTIQTHLHHWLDFIGKDVKLKELERTDCENYFHSRTKTKKGLSISQTTVENEQSTINAMMAWLHKKKETHIEAFDFKKLKKLDTGIDKNRRAVFTDEEIQKIELVIDKLITETKSKLDEDGGLTKLLTLYYLMISLMTGLRRGEQLQLKWKDISEFEHKSGKNKYNLVKITVRGETSKVRKTRVFVVKDLDYFETLLKFQYERMAKLDVNNKKPSIFAEFLIFSSDGKSAITPRAIGYNFDKVLELADIPDSDKRDLVPYSFRHYFITKKVNSNLPIASIAEICGTSITQIEKTYYHTTMDKMVSNALADYQYKDGVLVPK